LIDYISPTDGAFQWSGYWHANGQLKYNDLMGEKTRIKWGLFVMSRHPVVFGKFLLAYIFILAALIQNPDLLLS